MKLILRNLTAADENAFLQGAEAWQGEELSWYTFEWQPGTDYLAMLQRLKQNAKGQNLPENFVPSSMLYAFVQGEIVGRVNIRHTLNEFLLERGGHIGYAVAPAFRKKGYAYEMFKQTIPFCRDLGLQKLLITCADDNLPSWKIIEKFGGKLENKFTDTKNNEVVRRYWLDLSK